MREFKGRIVTPGTVSAEALVSHGGLNTLASFQKALQFGDKRRPAATRITPISTEKRWQVRHSAFPRL